MLKDLSDDRIKMSATRTRKRRSVARHGMEASGREYGSIRKSVVTR